VDAAISKVLRSSDDSSPTAEGTDAQQLKVTQFVQSALTNHSARAPLQGAATTIAQAIDSASADLRRMVSYSNISLARSDCQCVSRTITAAQLDRRGYSLESA